MASKVSTKDALKNIRKAERRAKAAGVLRWHEEAEAAESEAYYRSPGYLHMQMDGLRWADPLPHRHPGWIDTGLPSYCVGVVKTSSVVYREAQ